MLLLDIDRHWCKLQIRLLNTQHAGRPSLPQRNSRYHRRLALHIDRRRHG
jgi:hypothetical protein